MRLCKVGLQVAVGVETPLATVALELDVGNLGAVILVIWMKFLKMSLSVELKTKNSRTQVTLIGFNFFRRLATPR